MICRPYIYNIVFYQKISSKETVTLSNVLMLKFGMFSCKII
ncbi:hypothetical protein A1OE_913 [Candidatus Endolissoclinum faulkneri L2]|uniref:Uncharacterized protein n=1 Tax=Candidatus Endolissoclinum faulkneri L2 TaxID=1193729 RepID=K7YNJ4_9PROT|nr:hypothetical protein A1OE_913 [Candidatus Endolissoclinum faulkneri L2]